MSYKNFFPFLLMLSLFFSCKNTNSNANSANSESQNAQNTEGVILADSNFATVTPITDKAVLNFTIVPYQQVGSITAATTEGSLKQIFGDKNVLRENRGEVQTLIFKGTPNELQIAWRNGAKYQKIESIIIMSKGSKWRSPEGIGIGSTFKELEAANGKAVTLAPIGDEEEGIFRPLWNGGKVHPKFVVSFDKVSDKVFAMQINF